MYVMYSYEYAGITEAAEFTKRLLSDYKEGKAYSYFDSGWLQELLYHPIEGNNYETCQLLL